MKYIFLDIDGVLNDNNYIKKMHNKYGGRFFCENVPFNPRSLKNLKKIIDKTNGLVILTSSWRFSNDCMIILKARLNEYNIKIHDMTARLHESRGQEILVWLKTYANKDILNMYYDNTKYEYSKIKDNYIILDDERFDILNYFSKNHFVKLDYNKGLTHLKTNEAIRKLNKNV